MCKCLHTILALRDLSYRRHVIGFPVLEPLLTVLTDGRELAAESVHTVIRNRDAHALVVLEERTGGAAQGYLASW